MNNWQDWYNSLNKPEWTPTGDIISLIWTFLYPIIFITYGYVFYKKLWKKDWENISLTPFLLNLLFNFLFTPIFFFLKNIPLATLDITLVWITTIWTMFVIYKRSKIIAMLQIPYLIWVSVALTIQYIIFLSNL